jgi:glyoxylase-like metal-dependent hydrolase (beta-lactamase superfamily II)
MSAILRGTLLVGLVLATGCTPPQEQARTEDQTQSQSQTLEELAALAQAALGPELSRVEFEAQGWEACLGQPWNISEGWARWSLSDYRRVLDYDAVASLQTATRLAGMDPGKLGGCGAQPVATPVAQRSTIQANAAWPSLMNLWLTPHGFLDLAIRQGADLSVAEGLWTVRFEYDDNGVRYPVSGTFNDAGQLLATQTRIDDSVFGDMLVENRFGPYRAYGELNYPASIEQLQGGFPVLHLDISAVMANAATEIPVPQASPGPAGAGAPRAEDEGTVALTPDIIVSLGDYQGVFVNQPDGIVVIDGLQNDQRSAALIRQAKALFPGKPISHVIVTHNHFDHASGLRDFVAEGAVIVTHRINEAFFREALSAPRTLLNPDPQEQPVKILGVDDHFVLGSGEQRIELHRLLGNIHADDMMIAWLPAVATVVESDVLQPWINPVFAGSGGPHPYLVHLAAELERLQLPYEQFVPVHRPPEPPLMSRQDLMDVVGQE